MPVYITPEKIERVDCPHCGFRQAVRIGKKYRCIANDNSCRFFGTLEDAARIKCERLKRIEGFA